MILLHAMARLISDGFQFCVVLLSHGWQEQPVRQLIDELGLAAYCSFSAFSAALENSRFHS